ncbi:hypothetical protein D3C79_803900 [compost metagenome]
MGKLGAHQAWAYRHHPHLWRPLRCQRLHQGQHAGLGCAVRCCAWRGTQAADAANKHDATAVGLGLHQQVGLLGDIERRNQVETDNPLMKTWRGAAGVGRGAAAGVVDQHIEAAVFAADAVKQALQGGLVAHVGGDEVRLALSHARQLLGQVAPTHDHLGPGSQKAAGNASANAFGSAGDQYHLAVVIQPRVTTHGTLLMLVLRATLGAKPLHHVV